MDIVDLARIFLQIIVEEVLQDADGQLTLGSTKLLSSAAYPRGLRVRDVSLRYDSASGIFTVTLQVGTVDSTLAETDFEVRRLNHT